MSQPNITLTLTLIPILKMILNVGSETLTLTNNPLKAAKEGFSRVAYQVEFLGRGGADPNKVEEKQWNYSSTTKP